MKGRPLNDREQIRCVKMACLDLIQYSLATLGVSVLHMDGYERDDDRIHFKNDGHRCILYGVEIPSSDDFNDGIIRLIVLTTHNGIRDLWTVPLSLDGFRTSTLKKIACEVYDWCKGEDWDDWDDAYKDTVAGWIDSYWAGW